MVWELLLAIDSAWMPSCCWTCSAKALASKHAGIVAWPRDASPTIGENGDPMILFQAGDVPGHGVTRMSLSNDLEMEIARQVKEAQAALPAQADLVGRANGLQLWASRCWPPPKAAARGV